MSGELNLERPHVLGAEAGEGQHHETLQIKLKEPLHDQHFLRGLQGCEVATVEVNATGTILTLKINRHSAGAAKSMLPGV